MQDREMYAFHLGNVNVRENTVNTMSEILAVIFAVKT